jgi:hypothetical protein
VLNIVFVAEELELHHLWLSICDAKVLELEIYIRVKLNRLVPCGR